MKKICPICKKSFERPLKPKQRHCSKKCSYKGTKRRNFLRGTHFHKVWIRINRICNTKSDKFEYYAGRGIECAWNSFGEFRDDMYESYQIHYAKHGRLNTTIERVDNDGNYSKENCRWATRKEQANNRRSTIKLSYKGDTLSLAGFAEKYGLKKIAFWERIRKKGWSIEKAIETPFNTRK